MKSLRIYLKFQKRKENGQLYGFVTQKRGNWMGCYENYEGGKRIVIVAKELTPTTLENTLYQAKIIPMNNGKPGFIAVNLKIIKFKATVETILKKEGFAVLVKFGNRTIKYDPESKWKNERCHSDIANLLRHRVDIEDPERTAMDFETAVYYTSMKFKKAI